MVLCMCVVRNSFVYFGCICFDYYETYFACACVFRRIWAVASITRKKMWFFLRFFDIPVVFRLKSGTISVDPYAMAT